MAKTSSVNKKAGPADKPARRVSPAEYVRQVRQETAKVTWPSRKETTVTTAMVFVMVALASIFFFFADWVLSTGIRFFLNLGG